ncbi:phytanoyl-CoA dioxygenase family protein [Sphingopyxis sp. JAI128]|uniref:phytanoyl-CoA dioxygenase family protein n=1 Tax=Sphingopyxis sp. JAI128 TaxID=2723066 RepID=UPI0017EB017A|nr:phytanoyl-CoA dioxygenase family protein [Sphingopyxis sp. JAI128]MBB6426286.1 ectoine hydroxylase-related dioxygenase (phytanoyl-CoA dioxygenase family) [Sphingopyxis sp. JAI128]
MADIIGELRALFDDQPRHSAGIRLHGIEALRPLLGIEGQIGTVAASIIGPNSRAVRAILFDKTAETNWSLGWHQDRTICVRERVDMAGYGPWTVKSGMQHVAPPFDLLSRMVTLRVHLDDVSENNAPLMIVPGSHKLGRIPEVEIDAVVSRLGQQLCLAETGDIWAYATPIVHGSKAATRPERRRVLQIDFSGDDLPGDLDWLGV